MLETLLEWLRFIIAFTVVILIAQALCQRSDEQLADWHEFEAWRKRTAVDGTRISGDIMRRKVRGAWQYREMTLDEAWELSRSRAM